MVNTRPKPEINTVQKSPPDSVSSPAEQPNLGGTGQSFKELFFLCGAVGGLNLLPGKLPFFFSASGHSVTVDNRPQVRMDAESQEQALFSLSQNITPLQ